MYNELARRSGKGPLGNGNKDEHLLLRCSCAVGRRRGKIGKPLTLTVKMKI
jgi:hypothetical protein